MIRTSRRHPALPFSVLILAAPALSAQATPSPVGCTDQICDLRLETDLWSELIVRGERGERVGRLGSFGSGVDMLLAGPDSAAAHAREYVSSARRAGIFGGLEAVALAVGAARRTTRRSGEVTTGDAVAVVSGAVAVVVDAPLAVKARREPARAVWWFNAALTH